MSSADSAAQGFILRLTSPQFLAEALALLIAVAIAFVIARSVARVSRRTATPAAAHGLWRGRLLEVCGALAPLLAALAVLLAAHSALAAAAFGTAAVDSAAQVVMVLVVVRLGVYMLGRLLGPGSWVRSRQLTITLVL